MDTTGRRPQLPPNINKGRSRCKSKTVGSQPSSLSPNMPISWSHKGGGYAQRHDSAAMYNSDRYQYAASRDMNGHYYKQFTFHSGSSGISLLRTTPGPANNQTQAQIASGDA